MIGKGYVVRVFDNNYLILQNKDGNYTATKLAEEKNEDNRDLYKESYMVNEFKDIISLLNSIRVENGLEEGGIDYDSNIKVFHLSEIMDLKRGTKGICGCSAYCTDDGLCLSSNDKKYCDSCYSNITELV